MAISAPTASEGKTTDVPKKPGPSSKTQVVVKSGKEASTVLGSIVKTVGYLLETNAEIQMKAVIKIQALFRGVKDRKTVKALHARKVLMQGGLLCFLVAWVLLLLADCISFDLFAQAYAAVGVGVFAWFVARSYRKVTKKKKIKKINTSDPTSQVAKEAPVAVKKNAAKVVRSAPPPAVVEGSAGKDGAAPSMDSTEKWARSIGIFGVLPKTKDGKIDPYLSLKLTGIAVLICGLAMPVVVKVLTFYAAVKSFRSIQTPDPEDDKQWLTFWLVFSLVELVFFGAHIVIMPFEALFDHWGGIGLILDGMKCVILICLGVFEGAQTMYPKLEPYLLKADAVATAKALKYQKFIMDEVDANGDGKITMEELKARLSGKKEARTSQPPKAAAEVKTNEATSVNSMPPPVATPRPTKQPEFSNIAIKKDASWLRDQDKSPATYNI